MSGHLKWLAGIVALAAGIVGLWVALGFPSIATSMDISKLTTSQNQIAVQVYQNRLNSLILLAPQVLDSSAGKAWQEELMRARKKLGAAEDRMILEN